MPAGRPTKHNEEADKTARDYLENHKDYGDPVPTVSGLATELKVAKSTVYDWAKDGRGVFPATLEVLDSQQERMLLAGGLKGDLNSNITKLMLANHGYSERKDVNHGVSSELQQMIEEAQGTGGGFISVPDE